MRISHLVITLLGLLAFIYLVTSPLLINWFIDWQVDRGHKKVRPNDYRIIYPAKRPASKTPPTANNSGGYYVVSLGSKLWLNETGYNSSMDFKMVRLMTKDTAYAVARDIGGQVHSVDMEIGGLGSGKHQFSVIQVGDKLFTITKAKDSSAWDIPPLMSEQKYSLTLPETKDTVKTTDLTEKLNSCDRYESADDAYVDAGKIGGTVLTFTLHEDQQWNDF